MWCAHGLVCQFAGSECADLPKGESGVYRSTLTLACVRNRESFARTSVCVDAVLHVDLRNHGLCGLSDGP